jgi:NADP-dependent 3-hydroxy acid dehydrogenase YdfG
VHELDVTNMDSIQAFVAAIPSDLSEIDVLVNNAGLALGTKHTFDNDIGQMHTMIDTNVKGIFLVMKALLPAMIERKRGHVCNICSSKSNTYVDH